MQASACTTLGTGSMCLPISLNGSLELPPADGVASQLPTPKLQWQQATARLHTQQAQQEPSTPTYQAVLLPAQPLCSTSAGSSSTLPAGVLLPKLKCRAAECSMLQSGLTGLLPADSLSQSLPAGSSSSAQLGDACILTDSIRSTPLEAGSTSSSRAPGCVQGETAPSVTWASTDIERAQGDSWILHPRPSTPTAWLRQRHSSARTTPSSTPRAAASQHGTTVFSSGPPGTLPASSSHHAIDTVALSRLSVQSQPPAAAAVEGNSAATDEQAQSAQAAEQPEDAVQVTVTEEPQQGTLQIQQTDDSAGSAAVAVAPNIVVNPSMLAMLQLAAANPSLGFLLDILGYTERGEVPLVLANPRVRRLLQTIMLLRDEFILLGILGLGILIMMASFEISWGLWLGVTLESIGCAGLIFRVGRAFTRVSRRRASQALPAQAGLALA